MRSASSSSSSSSYSSILFTLLLIAALDFNSHSAGAAQDPVLDIDGKQLRSGVDYYILPVFRGRGGGLTLAAVGNKTCPLDVVQDRLEVSRGLPLRFTPVNPKTDVIRVSIDHNIKFSASTVCVQSTVWKLEYDESTGQRFITTGGVEGNPGRETLSNWFKIEKLGDDDRDNGDYKLVFCPTVCNFCKVICRDVGVSVQEDGYRRLVLTTTTDDSPFKVVFKKA